jgi:purine-nucleoside phosphorylase
VSDVADRVSRAVAAVRPRLEGRQPAVAIVLGSGLGAFADRIGGAIRLPYRDVPGFPLPTVPGHGGELVVGTVAGRTVVAQSGRFHLYEGHDAASCALPARLFAELGIGVLLVTNAAGGVRRSFARGSLMLIADHINLTFRNPLIGPVLGGEERFPDMSEGYDGGLRRLARDVGREQGIRLEEGVYAGLLGPSYETPAEIRMLERLGADAVGMSTVTEVIAARARGLRCLGISTITNLAAGISPTRLSHEEVLETGARVQAAVSALVEGVVARL